MKQRIRILVVDDSAFMCRTIRQLLTSDPTIEVIGEAASRLTPEAQALFPAVPFRAMRGMRNIIAHDYGEVDLELVWQTAEADLPHLIETLEGYFCGNG